MRSNLVWPRPRSRNPVIRLIRGVWTLPTNLLGHLAGFVVSGARPTRVEGPAAIGWVYRIRPGIGLDWVGAVTLGHAILHRRRMFDDPVGQAVLAHELAHTRQHDWLGPLYLPLHILAQSTSALLSVVIPRKVRSRVHAYNPLEHTFICLGAQACYDLARGKREDEFPSQRYLAEFGL